MKDIIPKDTRYIPMTQQKSCCVPASISVVMYKLGIPLVPQELLGYHLGLIIDEKNKDLFWHPRTGERPKSGYGTQIRLKEYNPNVAFDKLNIPLKMVIHPVDKFKTQTEFVDFISICIKEDRDILACFDHGTLSGDDKKGGHVCVVDRLYLAEGIIRLIDPSPNKPKWRNVEINLLRKAMELHPSGGGGFWELK